jgi:hypothetical protein
MQIKIKVRGHLGEHWKDWFDNLEFKNEGEYTVMKGYVEDQAALHGIILKIRDLNLNLISVDSENEMINNNNQ